MHVFKKRRKKRQDEVGGKEGGKSKLPTISSQAVTSDRIFSSSVSVFRLGAPFLKHSFGSVSFWVPGKNIVISLDFGLCFPLMKLSVAFV